ncbi:hypothetical protein B0H13DRAFT_2373068 [Mycena leptocephala]|nr:hypothetical protein B0H13DRAFT_2373068 [Mycena leptocephala]
MSADDEVYRTEAEQGRDEEIASDDSDMEMVVDGEADNSEPDTAPADMGKASKKRKTSGWDPRH